MTTYMSVLLLCSGLVTLTAANAAETACSKHDVSSWGWRHFEEKVNVLETGTVLTMDVDFEHYEDSNLCKKNKTFGFTETTLWVSDGCRATFTVCYNESHTFDAKIIAMRANSDELVAEIKTELTELQLENNASKTLIQELKTELNESRHYERANTEELVAEIKAELNTQQTELKELQLENNQLKTDLNESRHIETGVVDCGGVLGLSSPQSRSPSVTFTTPYTSAPMVHLAVLDAGIHKDYYAMFYVKLVNTDTRGFTVECSVRGSGHYLGYLKVSWLSFP